MKWSEVIFTTGPLFIGADVARERGVVEAFCIAAAVPHFAAENASMMPAWAVGGWNHSAPHAMAVERSSRFIV